MPGLFRSLPPTHAQRLANDRHRPSVVLAVLSVLAVYAYLFTDLGRHLHLPPPEAVADRIGIHAPDIFDRDRRVHSDLRIMMTPRRQSESELLLAFFVFLAAAFLCSYYLPLAHKQASLALWSAVAMTWLYGPTAAAALMTAHLCVYLVLHADTRWAGGASAAAGISAFIAFAGPARHDSLLWALGLPAATFAGHRLILKPMARNPAVAAGMRGLVVHSAVVTVCTGAVLDGLGRPAWILPIGAILFFWQWQRIWLYYMDFQEGLVPRDLPLPNYLSVFWTPAVIPNWLWGLTTAQGYAYSNHRFYSDDKNTIILSGLRIWGVALIYLVLGPWIFGVLLDILSTAGLSMHQGRTGTLVADFVRGDSVGAASVLATTLLYLLGYFIFAAGILHFKVGAWRVCGYDVEAEFNRPWQSTNPAVFWSRFMFHYRAFLVRAFYYPIFFKRFKNHPDVRLFAAVLAAATFGNWIWVHLPARLYEEGLRFESVMIEARTFPYFLFLGLGIGVTQWCLLRRKRTRRPWSRDRWWAADFLAAYATAQFFALLLIFERASPGATVADLLRLFAVGFGLGKWTIGRR